MKVPICGRQNSKFYFYIFYINKVVDIDCPFMENLKVAEIMISISIQNTKMAGNLGGHSMWPSCHLFLLSEVCRCSHHHHTPTSLF